MRHPKNSSRARTCAAGGSFDLGRTVLRLARAGAGKSFRRDNNSVMRNGFWRKRLPSRPACSPTAASTRSPVMKMKIGRGAGAGCQILLNAIVKIESGDHLSGAGLQIQIAQNHVIGISIRKVQRLFGRGGAVHQASAGAEGIGHELQDAFLVINDQDFPSRERSGGAPRRIPCGLRSSEARAVQSSRRTPCRPAGRQ